MRTSGILLHISSLPSPGGIGSLGQEAYAFADFLHASGLRIWQVLPIGPVGYGESPYQSTSVFAGNPLLISCRSLREEGLLDYERCDYRCNQKAEGRQRCLSLAAFTSGRRAGQASWL